MEQKKIDELIKAAQCVYLACEQSVADDISAKLNWAVAEISRLTAELGEWKETAVYLNNANECLEKELAKYEEAKEDGRLIVLPDIKINKILYWVWAGKIMPVLYKGVQNGCIGADNKYHVICKMTTKKERTFIVSRKEFTIPAGDGRVFYTDDIGKTVFLTRREAEAALQEDSE